MAHCPQTLDTHLDFHSEIDESDLSASELANRPDAFKAFVFSVAFRKGNLLRGYNTVDNTVTRMSQRRPPSPNI